MSSQNDEIEYHTAPEWLTKEYLENILSSSKNDQCLKVTSLEVKPASAKGEHYASVMSRINVQYTCKSSNGLEMEQTGSYIAKTNFEGNESVSSIFSEYRTFKVEMDFYENIVPQLNSILKKNNINDEMFPEVLFVDRKHSAIIIEDLSNRSFRNADRIQGLDLAHARLALDKIVKMHATSAILNEMQPNVFKEFIYGIFNRHTRGLAPFFENTIQVCGDKVKEFKGPYIEYGEKLEKLSKRIMDITEKANDAEEHHFNVLVHGDFWTNNLMYTYDEEKNPIDLIMIDFQFCALKSPATDLHYFFHTSLKENLYLKHQNELVQYYFYNLSDLLKKLNYKGKIPSLHEFWIQLAEKSFYEVTSACVIHPLLRNEETKDADFMALVGSDERSWNFKRTLYKSENVQKNLKNLLPIFNRRGLLDM